MSCLRLTSKLCGQPFVSHTDCVHISVHVYFMKDSFSKQAFVVNAQSTKLKSEQQNMKAIITQLNCTSGTIKGYPL